MVLVFFAIQIITSVISSFTRQPQQQSTQTKPTGPVLTNVLPPKTTMDVLVKVFNSTHTLFKSRQLMEYALDTPQIDLEF
jgi:hypothetical protein